MDFLKLDQQAKPINSDIGERKIRYQKALAMINEWLKEASNHDEKTYPKIQENLDSMTMRCREVTA